MFNQASSRVNDDGKLRRCESKSLMKLTGVTAKDDHGNIGGRRVAGSSEPLQESIRNRRRIGSSQRQVRSHLNFVPSQHDQKVSITDNRFKNSGKSSEGESGSRYTCDAELLASLSLLFKQPSREERDSVSPTRAVLLDFMTRLPPFTHQVLLPWFSYSQRCGTHKSNFDSLHR